MSDDLMTALMGARYSGKTDPFGVAGMALAQNAGALSNPFGSVGTNAAATIGASLLAGLLAGVGQNRADSNNAAMMPLAGELLNAQPERAKEIIAQYPRLADVQTASEAIKRQNALDLAKKAQELGLSNTADIAKAEALIPVEKAKQAALMPGEINRAAQVATAQKTAEIKAENGAYGGGLSPKDARDAQKVILANSAGRPETVQYSAAKTILDTMVAAKDINTPAADSAYLYGLPKLLDPSVVKEGEMALMMRNMPGLQQYAREIEGAFSGTARLSPEAKKTILDIAKIKYGTLGAQYNEALKPYEAQVQANKLDPVQSLPFPAFTPFPAATPSASPTATPTLTPQQLVQAGYVKVEGGWRKP